MDIDRNAPATKGDIGDLKNETAGFIADLKNEMTKLVAEANERHEMLRSEMHHQFHELTETMRDSQTELLKAFYGYTSTTDVKFKDTDGSVASIRERMTVIERRVLEIEKKILRPLL